MSRKEWQLKSFVRASEEFSSLPTEKPSTSSFSNSLSGPEARQFYEDTVDVNSSSNLPPDLLTPATTTSPEKPQKFIENSRLEAQFLRAAQENDIHELKRCLEQNVDINCKDIYGWTALMCSACSGAADTLYVLLQNGADVSIHDPKRNSAWSLANRHRKYKVVDILTEYLNSQIKEEGDKKSAKEIVETSPELEANIYCKECKTEVSESNWIAHRRSVIHLFSISKRCPNPPSYQIPESNVGFQMLLRDGWDKQNGLGPSGEGRKYPIKTMLKRDNRGLGSKNMEKDMRVTHFKPYDVSAVRSEGFGQKAIKSRQQIATQLKMQQLERNFRTMFYGQD